MKISNSRPGTQKDKANTNFFDPFLIQYENWNINEFSWVLFFLMYQLKLINDLKIIRLLNFCSGTMNEQHSAPECHLSILHFNDVYDLQASKTEPKAGAAGFKSLMDRYRLPSTLTLFSGDVFSPALLSSEHKG